MSSSNRTTRIMTAAALLGVTLVLGACGFRPLYAHNPAGGAGGQQSVTALAAVKVNVIAEREGQMMRTALQRRLAVRPSGAPARYTLSVKLKEAVRKLAVERNSFATRANLMLTATYSLTRISDGRQLTNGHPRSVASYNILSSQYATLAAQTDARARAIDALADDIHARLASHFTGPGATLETTGGPAQP